MMKEGTIIPQPLRVETEPYSRGWETIKNADADGVDRDIRRADWNFFFLAASIQATALGSWGERTVRRAMERVLAKAEPSKFNCLEITEISAKQFLGFPYGARLGALTTYPEEPISTGACRADRTVVDADWASPNLFVSAVQPPASRAEAKSDAARLNLLSPWGYWLT
jgi:hypothetical protein